MKEQIFLGIIGLSGGLVIAGGVTALLVGLGVITRFVGISHTADRVKIYETAISAGAVCGTLMTVYQPTIPLELPGLAVLGLFSGIFVGGWILALAEVVNIFPILARRIGLTRGLSVVVIAIALGKMTGSLLHFYLRW
ncbi:stage V sporulation protein AB [Blautia sp. OF03-15BH]|uniref:stage V sporulation protein AB n=1 Tax=Blautia sp. OF03-15BH TaxID=2292287 RepID=UPI000E541FA2|nr:stage V sporulation protein AB [Blautia sp. OF03-15BH]RGY03015.1 stage V sporulation protein AB [Blautia sp. OF03-15BH]